MFEERDLGDLGELSVAKWCAQVGITSHKPSKDRYGWDCYIEFPKSRKKSVFNLHDPALEIKIQVKATDSRKRSLAIKISNLWRLCTCQVPAFIIFLEFDGKEDPQRAFLVHVGESLIEDTLRRVREQEIGLNSADSPTLTVKYDESNEISQLNGISFKERILKYIPSGMIDYLINKNKILSSVGFENGCAEMKFDSCGLENVNDLIDASLGLKKSAKITNVIGFEKRFGHADAVPFIDKIEGEIEILDLKPTIKGVISFSTRMMSLGISYECVIYTSNFIRDWSSDLFRFRISTDYFDIVVHPNKNKIDITWGNFESRKFNISELQKLVKLITAMQGSGEQINLTVKWDDKPPLEFFIHAADDPEVMPELRRCLKNVSLVIDYFDIQDVNFSVNEIYKNKKYFDSFSSFFEDRTAVKKLSLEKGGDNHVNGNKISCLCFIPLYLGQYKLGVFFILQGSSYEEDGMINVITNKVDVIQRFSLEERKKFPKSELISLVDKTIASFSEEDEVVVLFDTDEIED